MLLDEIIEKLRTDKAALDADGVKAIGVFASVEPALPLKVCEAKPARGASCRNC